MTYSDYSVCRNCTGMAVSVDNQTVTWSWQMIDSGRLTCATSWSFWHEILLLSWMRIPVRKALTNLKQTISTTLVALSVGSAVEGRDPQSFFKLSAIRHLWNWFSFMNIIPSQIVLTKFGQKRCWCRILSRVFFRHIIRKRAVVELMPFLILYSFYRSSRHAVSLHDIIGRFPTPYHNMAVLYQIIACTCIICSSVEGYLMFYIRYPVKSNIIYWLVVIEINNNP